MDTKITEERRSEILLKAREFREKRRTQGQQESSSSNNPNEQGSFDAQKSDDTRRKIMASILNDKFQTERAPTTDDEKLTNQDNNTNENYQYQYQQHPVVYQPQMHQLDSSSDGRFGLDELIKEKSNAVGEGGGDMFSLEEIKQRLNEKLERNAEMKEQIKQERQSQSQQQIKQNNSRVNQRPPRQDQQDYPSQQQQQQHSSSQRSLRTDSFNNREGSQMQNPFLTRQFPEDILQQQQQQQQQEQSLQYQDISNAWRDNQNMTESPEEQSLYEKKRAHSFTQRRSEEEYIRQRKFTFKPEIRDMPVEIYGEQAQNKISRQEQWERLLQDKIQTLTSRENLKILAQQKEISDKCTFVPQINEISKLLTADKHPEVNINERLFLEGARKQEEREELRRKFEDAQTFPFQPDVRESVMGLKGEAAFSPPLYERLDDVIKEKQQLKLQLQMKNQNDQAYTFKPALNPNSETIAKQKFEGKTVVQRLLDDIREKEERKNRLIENHTNSVSQMCTFQPSINPSNYQILDQHNSNFDEDNMSSQQRQQEFVTRQHLVADHLKERLQQKIQQLYGADTFKPQINQISQYLVAADEDRAAETAEEKITRLFQQDQLKRQITQEQIQKAYYDKFSFAPAINPLSKKIARKRSLDSLAFDKDKNRKQISLKQKVESSKMKECSFQPRTNKNKKFDNVKSHYALEAIDVALRECKENKEKNLEQIRKQMEYEEMKECTFNPITKQLERVDYEERLGQMRGVDKFLKQKELTKKQQEQIKLRENEVFQIKDQSQFRASNKTKVQPFALSKGNGPTQKKIREELLKEHLEQCTFQPNTNESKNKELIKQIIANEGSQYPVIPEEEDFAESQGAYNNKNSKGQQQQRVVEYNNNNQYQDQDYQEYQY